MAKYARDTTVSESQSREEIAVLLKRYDASEFAAGWDKAKGYVAFEMRGRRVRFVVRMPTQDAGVQAADNQYGRAGQFRQRLYDQAVRRCWRSLVLVIKAKLEAMDSGIETFEDAFMPHIILPSGQTVSEWLAPQLAAAYTTGDMPPLLASGN